MPTRKLRWLLATASALWVLSGCHSNAPPAGSIAPELTPFDSHGLGLEHGSSRRILAVVPPNDELSNATVIGTLPFSETLDTTLATEQPNDSAVSCASARHSVWYRYTNGTPGATRVTFDSFGSSYPVAIAVAIPTDANPPTPETLKTISCVGGFAINFGQGATNIEVPSGQTLYVLLGDIDLDGGTLVFNASVTPAGPANDDIDQATAIAVGASATNDLTNATTDLDDPIRTCGLVDDHTVWYSFTPDHDLTAEIRSHNPDALSEVKVFTGTRGSLTLVQCSVGGNDQVMRFPVQANTTYYLMGSGGPGNQTVSTEEYVAPEVSVRIDRAVVDTRTGIVTLNGSGTSNKPLQQVSISGLLSQVVQRQTLGGFFSDNLPGVSTTFTWSASVAADNGLFKVGEASVSGFVFAGDEFQFVEGTLSVPSPFRLTSTSKSGKRP